jgi:uncharacterized protein (TIGR02246 family)
MRRYLRPTSAFIVLIGLAACQQGPAPLSDADVAAIQQVGQDFANAAQSEDWDGLTALFAADAIRMPFDAPTEHGRAAIRAAYAAVDSVAQWAIQESHVDGVGDLAYLRQTYTATGFLGGMPAPVSYSGKSVTVLRRQPDGKWLIVMDIWNTDAPIGQPE